jgi:hypothetical protein
MSYPSKKLKLSGFQLLETGLIQGTGFKPVAKSGHHQGFKKADADGGTDPLFSQDTLLKQGARSTGFAASLRHGLVVSPVHPASVPQVELLSGQWYLLTIGEFHEAGSESPDALSTLTPPNYHHT